jgi:Zn finger protein HypA/HybF involved in hydrogenase expression
MLKKLLMTSMLTACVFVAMDTTILPQSNQENEESESVLSCSKNKFKEPKENEEALAACSKCKGRCGHRA